MIVRPCCTSILGLPHLVIVIILLLKGKIKNVLIGVVYTDKHAFVIRTGNSW